MDLTAWATEIGTSGPVTIAGMGTRGRSIAGVRSVLAPAGIEWFEPAEMTVCCGAGTPVAELAAVLADHDQTVAIPDDLKDVANSLGKLIQSLQTRGVPGDQMPLQGPYQLEDCGWVANRWCELLPIQPELKQRLMTLDNPLLRLELVSDILERTGISL